MFDIFLQIQIFFIENKKITYKLLNIFKKEYIMYSERDDVNEDKQNKNRWF